MNTRLYKRSFFQQRGFKTLFFLLFLLSYSSQVNAQQSLAREWNELTLEAIRNDFARPTVHARNLFHISVGMYDAWAAYDSIAKPYMLGDSVGGLVCPFTGVPTPSDIDSARNKAISFAAYRLLKHRFQNSPGASDVMPLFDTLMVSLAYDTTNTSVNYVTGDPAALGNYIAQHIISFGLQDGSNEQNDYINQYYNPVNPSLAATLPGNPDIVDPDRWQPLSLDVFIDQSGNVIPFNTPDFLSPEWGDVTPFSLNDSVKTVYTRNGDDYVVYHDPNDPPYLDTIDPSALIEEYQWGFSLVSIWSSHLDSSSNVLWDISPASIGNVQSYPTNVPDLRNFYNLTDGGDPGTGHSMNPSTGLPYAPQMVPRSDYARVLAEFWADGPDSETPPGHWFELLNYVNDHPSFQKKWQGEGNVLDELEWDVKAYFTMGGTVHDAAVTAWGIKGWYDYIRPVSAIRLMADNGQSSDSTLANYAKNGIPLVSGYIELVVPSDTLQGFNASDTGKIKVLAWRGPDYIVDPENDVAGVGWILAENWWPYQRPTFITPPFAGYVSGHSTFSRAAAEVMTAMTGDEFFPGGMGEFLAEKDSFLVFEDGPSQDITLQWATYRDASDQCSLSRIWGGIHPPVDDIPGRLIGEKIGIRAFDFAEKYMDARQPSVVSLIASLDTISPIDVGISNFTLTAIFDEVLDTLMIPTFTFPDEDPLNTLALNTSASGWLNDSTYQAIYDVNSSTESVPNITVEVNGASDPIGNPQVVFQAIDVFSIDTKAPSLEALSASVDTISLNDVGAATFILTAVFDEVMDTLIIPTLTFPNEDPFNTIMLNGTASNWLNDSTFLAIYDVNNSSELVANIDVEINGASDRIGNPQVLFQGVDIFSIDTEFPNLIELSASIDTISLSNIGISTFVLNAVFDKVMDTMVFPLFTFPNENPLNTIALNVTASSWLNDSTFLATYDVNNSSELVKNIDVEVNGASDPAGNSQPLFQVQDLFNIDTKSPNLIELSVNIDTISPADVGVSNFILTAIFDEVLDTLMIPTFTFPDQDPLNTITLNTSASGWLNDSTYQAIYDVNSSTESVLNITVEVNGASDPIGNPQVVFQGIDVFSIDTKAPSLEALSASVDTISLNDVGATTFILTAVFDEVMDTLIIPTLTFPNEDPFNTIILNGTASNWLNDSTFLAIYDVNNSSELVANIDVEINGASDRIGNPQVLFQGVDIFSIDTKSPSVFELTANLDTISLNDVGVSTFVLTAVFDEVMDVLVTPAFAFPSENPLNTIILNVTASNWLNDSTFLATYNVTNSSELVTNIDVDVNGASDRIGNPQPLFQKANLFNIDTKAPSIAQLSASVDTISLNDIGISKFVLTAVFDEVMDTLITPTLIFPNENPLNTISLNVIASNWLNDSTFLATYDIINSDELVTNIDVEVNDATDRIGNPQVIFQEPDLFTIDTKSPNVFQLSANLDTISLSDVGVSTFLLTAIFDEVMDVTMTPSFTFPNESPLNTIGLNSSASSWLNDSTYLATYDVNNSSELVENIDVEVNGASDPIGNTQVVFQESDLFSIDTELPNVIELSTNIDTITLNNVGLANFSVTVKYNEKMDTTNSMPVVSFPVEDPLLNTLVLNLNSSQWQDDSTYISWFDVSANPEFLFNIDVQVNNATDKIGNLQTEVTSANLFNIHTKQPGLLTIIPSVDTISYIDTGVSTFFLALYFDGAMDTTNTPIITFPTDDPLSKTLVLNTASSHWTNETSYITKYDVLPTVDTLYQIDVSVTSVTDAVGNDILANNYTNVFSIDKKEDTQPELLSIIPSVDTINYSDTGISTFFLALYFNEPMDMTNTPVVTFPNENPLSNTLVLNTASSVWTNPTSFVAVYDVLPTVDTLYQIDVSVTSITDLGGKDILDNHQTNVFSIEKKKKFIPINSDYLPVSIYPNPILPDGNFTVGFEENIQTLTATITDVRGKIIQSTTYNDRQFLNLNIEGAGGVYILILESGDKKAVIKLVKK